MTKSELTNAWLSNPDGATIGWVNSREGEIYRGIMTLNDYLKLYAGLPKKGLFIHHFRYGTSGAKIKGLTHNFPLIKTEDISVFDKTYFKLKKGDEMMFLSHNGILNNWESDYEKLKPILGFPEIAETELSDTKYLAMVYNFAKIGLDEFKKILKKYGGKYTILKVGEAYSIGGFIQYKKDAEVKVSNTYSFERRWSYSFYDF